MSETMEDFSNEINESMRVINTGDMIEGTVVGISDTDVTLDLQYYAEGIIKAEDYSGDPSFNIKQNVNVGDTVNAVVLRMDDGQGNILLSRKKAVDMEAWEKFSDYLKNKTHVKVKINQAVKGGVTAFLEGVRAFIPASKLSLSFVEDLEQFVGQEVEAIVITADEAEKRLVLSVRDVLREQADEDKARTISNMKVGLVTEGTVETIKPYGAFVNIGNGVSGLVHISQITNIKRLRNPGEILKEGQTVKVKVTAVKDGKISLSMKALEEAAPEKFHEEKVELPKTEELTTSLGSLLGGLHLDN